MVRTGAAGSARPAAGHARAVPRDPRAPPAPGVQPAV